MSVEPKTLTVQELLNSPISYIIPLYQRNFSWGSVEIEQLLQDVWDKFERNQGDTCLESSYFIGTLVVDNRKENVFEIIDGQQRYTILVLVNAIVKEYFNDAKVAINELNLNFDARPEAKEYISNVYKKGFRVDDKPKETECLKLHRALEIIRYFFERKRTDTIFSNYMAYFYHNVKVIQVGVPEGTDINHYFEVMNNRGKQLEAHEILKAYFLKEIEDNQPEYKDAFSCIWNACSQMGIRIQMCFDNDLRKRIFGKEENENNLSVIPTNGIEKIHEQWKLKVSPDEKLTSNDTLLSIIQSSQDNLQNENSKTEPDDKYNSVIDFPNFLLIVLRIYKNSDDISLDDKRLLDEFGYTKKERIIDPLEFVSLLLKCRTLFDNYIIKQEDKDEAHIWKILAPKIGSSGIYWVNTFSQSEEESEEDINNLKMIMMQTMFHVSFPANNSKRWLYKILSWLVNEAEKREIGYLSMMKELEIISQFFYNEVCEKPITYNNSTHFVFNLLDYLLWHENKKEHASSEIKSAIQGLALSEIFKKNRQYCNVFKFVSGNSVEHLWPQKHIDKIEAKIEEEKKTILDSFGNLCLISAGSNSEYSDNIFDLKKVQFKNKTERRSTVESLKQVIMFSYEKWTTVEIKEHEQMMMELLKAYNYF